MDVVDSVVGRKDHITFGAFALIVDEAQVVETIREVRTLTAKDYIDVEGYWISPDRSIRRKGNEGGDQQIIAQATEACSDAEWNRICDALKVSLFKMH